GQSCHCRVTPAGSARNSHRLRAQGGLPQPVAQCVPNTRDDVPRAIPRESLSRAYSRPNAGVAPSRPKKEDTHVGRPSQKRSQNSQWVDGYGPRIKNAPYPSFLLTWFVPQSLTFLFPAFQVRDEIHRIVHRQGAGLQENPATRQGVKRDHI